MRLIIFLSVALAATSLVASGEQQRILRRVIKSTPTASNLGRVRAVTVRSSGPEKGAVSEISSKEAAAFGTRSTNETSAAAAPAATSPQQATKTKSVQTTSPSPSTTSTSSSTTTTTTTTSTAAPTPSSSITTSTTQASTVPKASERQQAAPQAAEVELLSSAPSSWQMMTAVEAPAAALIAAGARSASASDLSSSSSEETSSSASYAPQGDFLRSSGKTSYSAAGETFSRLRQQSSASSKTRQQQQQQQQSFFYPQQQQQQQLRASKTSNYQATKTNWYQPTSTTPRPAPIIQQQQQEQQYEQQNEQYVEQQQVESAAPPGQAEPFAFDFNTQDTSGNGQYRKEESDNNGVVRGSYGFRDASGMYRHVEYVADANGFRANIKSNEPGLNAPEGVESQPASTRFTSGGQAPVQQSQRFTGASNQADNSAEWQAASSSSDERANLALAPPDFESSHKPERIQRAARYFRN